MSVASIKYPGSDITLLENFVEQLPSCLDIVVITHNLKQENFEKITREATLKHLGIFGIRYCIVFVL